MTEPTENEKLGKLLIVIGMPGAGKTTYMERLHAEHPEYSLFDDYQKKANTQDKTADPRLSDHYDKLVSDLRAGKTAVVSDIRYIIPHELNQLLVAVLAAAPDTMLEFKVFENDPEACRRNVLSRNRDGRVEKELEIIDTYARYFVAPGVETRAVYK